jgi:hypothetical protein
MKQIKLKIYKVQLQLNEIQQKNQQQNEILRNFMYSSPVWWFHQNSLELMTFALLAQHYRFAIIINRKHISTWCEFNAIYDSLFFVCFRTLSKER